MHNEAVDEAGFGGFVKSFPQQNDDEAGDGGGQIEDEAKEDFSARNFLQKDGEKDGREERHGDHQNGVSRGSEQGLPPIGVPQEIGEVVEEDPGRGAEVTGATDGV